MDSVLGDVTRRHFVGALASSGFLPSGAQKTGGASDPRALLIGLADYRMLPALRHTVADANALGDRLDALGFSTVRLINPTFRALQEGVGSFCDTLSETSLSLVFFAGHGFQVSGTSYITAIDTSNTMQDLLRTVLPTSYLLKTMAARRPKQSVLVLDACRNNPLPPSMTGNETGFASIAAPEGFYIAFSAGTGETALDDLGPDDPNKNGVFTRAFLNNLNLGDSFDSIIKRTRVGVAKMADSVNHSQHPAIYDQTEFEFRLDGSRVGPGSSSPLIRSGKMTSTAVVIFAVTKQAETQYPGAVADAAYMHGVFNALGADVFHLPGVTLAEAQRKMSNIADFDYQTIVMVFFGPAGILSHGSNLEGFLVFSDDPNYSDEHGQDFVMPLWEVGQRLRKPGRSIFILSDMGAVYDGESSKFIGEDVHTVLGLFLGRAVRDPKEDDDFGSIGVLLSASYNQGFPDVQRPHGAFPLALANALARPGLTFLEIAHLVRTDVEQITDQSQTPMLLATRTAMAKVLVQDA